MVKYLFFVLISILVSEAAFAQTVIIVPPFHDRFCDLVRKLESGDTAINYREFRESFIESEQFVVAYRKKTMFDSLKNAMYEALDKKSYQDVVTITKEMLSIDYTSMLAHKILRQTYDILGDTVNRNKYQAIELGLLISIYKYGNGKTCDTGWPVIQISEEYFILDMNDAQLTQQSIDNTGGLCDKMEVKTDEGEKTYYFDISEVVKGENKIFEMH
jgi:hypothetical protein